MRLSDQPNDSDALARVWFARQQSGTLSDAQRRELTDWLAASEANRAAWQRVQEDWQTMGRYRSALSQELNKARRRQPGRRTTTAAFKWMAAAIIVLAVCLPVVYQGITGTVAEWQTAVGEQQQIHLPGGALISLDTATHVTILQNWFTHHVQLHTGEIYLETASGWQTLKIAAGDYEIRNVGTRFSVRYHSGRLAIKVAEGAVKVNSQTRQVILNAGEALSVDAVGADWKLAALSGDIAHWRNGLLVFNAHRLHDVLEELARYHSVQFQLAEPTLGEKRVSGRFRLDELDTNLQIIAETLKLQVKHPSPGYYELSAL